jgi:hypothetical protein
MLACWRNSSPTFAPTPATWTVARASRSAIDLREPGPIPRSAINVLLDREKLGQVCAEQARFVEQQEDRDARVRQAIRRRTSFVDMRQQQGRGNGSDPLRGFEIL